MNLQPELLTALSKRDIDEAEKILEVFPEPNDKRSQVELAVRSYAVQLTSQKKLQSREQVADLVDLALTVVDRDLCFRSLPHIILADLFDTSTTALSEELFAVVEQFGQRLVDLDKNHMLRMCNNILRRLSRSVDTVFCGRILIFLARHLPLQEKSGLNLMGYFNTDNVTTFEPEPQQHQQESTTAAAASDVKLETDLEEGEAVEDIAEGNSSSACDAIVDFNLYTKFWQLQKYFNAPINCYSARSWKEFQNNTKEVLSVFTSYKLDDIQQANSLAAKRERLGSTWFPGMEDDEMQPVQSPATADFGNEFRKFKCQSDGDDVVNLANDHFFKYLTSQRLLQLQLNDSNFRRYVLIQFLILFQYLTSDKPAKIHRQLLSKLTDEQQHWIEATESKVYMLLKETFPEGGKFSLAVRHILTREQHWIDWKNKGCEAYDKDIIPVKMPIVKRRARRRHDADLIDLGAPELTKLWKLQDNFAACKDVKRDFTPSIADFFAPAIEAFAKGNDEMLKNEIFQWRAMRLLSVNEPTFLTNSAQNASSPPLSPYEILVKWIETVSQRHPDRFPQIGKKKTPEKTPEKPQQEKQSAKSPQEKSVASSPQEKSVASSPQEKSVASSPQEKPASVAAADSVKGNPSSDRPSTSEKAGTTEAASAKKSSEDAPAPAVTKTRRSSVKASDAKPEISPAKKPKLEESVTKTADANAKS